MSQPFVVATLFVLGLLLVGFVLRAWLKPLRLLFIPASVVGGLVGLGAMQALANAGDAGGQVASQVRGVLTPWPVILIAVVFAGLLIEKPGKRFSETLRAAGRQGIVVWIIVFGQAFVGILATALVIAPFYDVPPAFGQLIETGFAGGHGTAAAMGVVYDNLGFPQGRDLGLLFATAGLIYGVVSGIAFVNLGARRGWLRGGTGTAGEATFRIPVVSGLEDRLDPPAAAYARVRADVIDPLAFQLCVLGAAFSVGLALQHGFIALSGLAGETAVRFLGNVPLFLFTLVGGWVVREVMHATGVGDLIDPAGMRRLTGIAMELLIVAALANLRLDVARDFLMPVAILLVVGAVWVALCLFVVAPLLLPRRHWFELGLINYGMSTATTAQGLLLLRIVDRDFETDAAEEYAAAAPLSAPFVGGGVVTVLVVPVGLEQFGYVPVLVTMALLLAALAALGWRLRDSEESRHRKEPRTK